MVEGKEDTGIGGRYEAGLAHGQADYLDGKPKSNPYPHDTAEHDGYGDGYGAIPTSEQQP